MLQYSFSNVDLAITLPEKQPFTVTGYSSGDGLITCTRRAPISETTFGARGEMVVSMQRIIAGDLTFSLLMAASDNQILQDYANTFQASAQDPDLAERGKAISAIMTDNMGDDVCFMNNGVIIAMPAMVRGQIASVVTWTITFESMVFVRNSQNSSTKIGEQAPDVTTLRQA